MPTASSAIAAAIGVGGAVLAVVAMLVPQLVAPAPFDPLVTTLSDYVFVDGVGWLFGASVLCLAVAGMGVLIGLERTGGLRTPWIRSAIWAAVVCAVLVAVFRTDLGESVSVSAQIHRYAAGVVFFCVPLAGVLIAARARRSGVPLGQRHRLWFSVAVTTVVLLVFLIAQFAGVVPALAEIAGLWQRALFLVESVLLAQLALLPTATARHREAVLVVPTPRIAPPTPKSTMDALARPVAGAQPTAVPIS